MAEDDYVDGADSGYLMREIALAPSRTDDGGPKSMTPVKRCCDCNGTGADYDADVRAFACKTCGGSGMIEAP